jgi:hypothetical protein
MAETRLVSSPKYYHAHGALHPEVLTKKTKLQWYHSHSTAPIFILFPKLKVSLKGCQFELVEEIQEKTLQQPNVNFFTHTYGILGKMEISVESVY